MNFKDCNKPGLYDTGLILVIKSIFFISVASCSFFSIGSHSKILIEPAFEINSGALKPVIFFLISF